MCENVCVSVRMCILVFLIPQIFVLLIFSGNVTNNPSFLFNKIVITTACDLKANSLACDVYVLNVGAVTL